MKHRFSELEKKQLLIFFLISYTIPLLMGLVMGLGYGKGWNISMLPGAQMFCPAMGVIAAMLLTKRSDPLIPRPFFRVFFIISFCLILLSFAAVPMAQNTSELIFGAAVFLGTISLSLIVLVTDKQKKQAYGLHWSSTRSSFWCIGLFMVLYCLSRAVLSLFEEGTSWHSIQQIFFKPLASVPLLSISFFMAWIPYFGEEYGWRYFLQPMLQKKFGKRAGILLLGVLWGVWHIHLCLFYYSSFDVLAIFAQQITCIFLGIIFAYAYMRTNNIWVPTVLHFINNNLSAVLNVQETVESAPLTWGDLLLYFGVSAVIFGGFLFTSYFKTADRAKKF